MYDVLELPEHGLPDHCQTACHTTCNCDVATARPRATAMLPLVAYCFDLACNLCHAKKVGCAKKCTTQRLAAALRVAKIWASRVYVETQLLTLRLLDLLAAQDIQPLIEENWEQLWGCPRPKNSVKSSAKNSQLTMVLMTDEKFFKSEKHMFLLHCHTECD